MSLYQTATLLAYAFKGSDARLRMHLAYFNIKDHQEWATSLCKILQNEDISTLAEREKEVPIVLRESGINDFEMLLGLKITCDTTLKKLVDSVNNCNGPSLTSWLSTLSKGPRLISLALLALDLCRLRLSSSANVYELINVLCELPADEVEFFVDATVSSYNVEISEDISLAFAKGKHLFKVWLLPVVSTLNQKGHYELVLWAEHIIYAKMIKRVETEEAFSYYSNLLQPILRSTGTFLKADNSLQGLCSPRDGEYKKPKILGFVVPNECMLAHVVVFLSMLEGKSGSGEAGNDVICFTLAGRDAEFRLELQKANVKLISIPEEILKRSVSHSICEVLLELKKQCELNKVDIAIWLSNIVNMQTAFSMRISPVQIWWSLKYHSYQVCDCEGLISTIAKDRVRYLYGKKFLALEGGLSSRLMLRSYKSDENISVRSQIKDKLSCRLLFGAYAREEKFCDPEYLDCVCNILEKVPGSAFVYTGRVNPENMQRFFMSRNLIERTAYLGWIDTGRLAGLLDVFSDTFPFGCGHTLIQSALVGTPFVTLRTKETEETGFYTAYRKSAPYGEGLNKLCLCNTPDEYEQKMLRLLTDEPDRRKAGVLCAEVIKQTFADTSKLWKSFEQNLDAIEASYCLSSEDVVLPM